MKKAILVVGARPNFMKAAPLYREFKKTGKINPILVHTGQHYDYKMSAIFFKDLKLPKPNYFLNVGGGSHAEQTAKIMIRFERVLIKEKPDVVLVFGDVNSTIAATLTAKKLSFPVAHVEAGLRSFDMRMPEEINRVLTDRISDLLFTPSKDADENLFDEGIKKTKVFMVGNIMIDSLKNILNKIDDRSILSGKDLLKKEYILVTLHRPNNVDDKKNLLKIFEKLAKVNEKKIIFPIHPRTRKNIKEFGIKVPQNITLADPLGYKEFISLEKNAFLVITDSGGIQEETTFLGVPCLTIRPNTERPITISHGTNKLVNYQNLLREIGSSLNDTRLYKKPIPYWDGDTAKRIARIIRNHLT